MFKNRYFFKIITPTLVLLLLVYVIFYSKLTSVSENRSILAYSFDDLEKNLCGHTLTPRMLTLSEKKKCSKRQFVSIAIIGGRTGNQMWEYASVWAVARRTGLEPYVPRCIRLKLDQIFDQLTVPAFEEIAHCPVAINTFVKSLEEWTFTNQSIILPRYTLQPELVLSWVQDIVQEFTFRKKLREKSQQVLRSFVKNSPHKNHTFVGVHVRRTDYIGYLMRKYNSHPAEPSFYLNAMAQFRSRFAHAIFVVVSDDPGWCAKKFAHKNDVFVASHKGKNTPALDLAIMAACNHSIYDYGTFGEWGAILAGGETIFYNLTRSASKKIGEVMKNWHAMS